MGKYKNAIWMFLLVVVIVFNLWINNLTKQDTYSPDQIRCYYCGKVISSGGRNIHGKSMYNGGVVKCSYCGTNNSIK